MKNKLLITLLSVTASYACDYADLNFDQRNDFLQNKAHECIEKFNTTRRQHLEDIFVKNIHKTVPYSELRERVYGFNERLFDDLLAFCRETYRCQPYTAHLIYRIGETKIKDRLLERLIR